MNWMMNMRAGQTGTRFYVVTEESCKSPEGVNRLTMLNLSSIKRQFCSNLQVSVTASSSVNDVASTMAEFGGAKKPAVPSARVMASSPTIGVPIHKRGRGHASSSSISTCSSLLAVKLRGVVTQHRNAAEAYMALCPSHSRA